MSDDPTPEALARALDRLDGYRETRARDIVPLEGMGVAHAHYRVAGTGALLRVPRLSQWGMAPADFLDYQAAAFERAGPSGVVPKLLGMLPVSDALPWGALVVEEITGNKPRLPTDMAAVAGTLAAIHALPVPPPQDRPPLQVHDDPVAATVAVIREQADFVSDAPIAREATEILSDAVNGLSSLATETAALPHVMTLVATDAHPGNYLMAADGRAVFVDLEKMLYGMPAIDLAHASLYTSTRFDPDIGIELSEADTAAFYDAYYAFVPDALAARVRPWAGPMRRLTWLRTITWCVRWTVLSARDPDWAAGRLPKRMRDHMKATIAAYLEPASLRSHLDAL